MNMTKKLKVGSKVGMLTLLVGMVVSPLALAGGGGGGGSTPSDPNVEGFDNLYNRVSSSRNSCSVSVQRSGSNTFYVPSGGAGRYHLLGWGNGTNGNSRTYEGLLTALASYCIFVAAANTANAGSGDEIVDAINSAKSRYSSKLQSNLRVCTSGHSQGGGGSYNAASRANANCVISVQADTRFTTQIRRSLPSNTEVVALWSEDDGLAPRDNGNERNTRNAARSAYASVESENEGHFTPVSGSGGRVGALQRLAAVAYLDTSSSRRNEFVQAFRRDSGSSATAASRNVSYASIR